MDDILRRGYRILNEEKRRTAETMIRRTWQKVSRSAAIIAVILWSPLLIEAQERCIVDRVVDGDTFDCVEQGRVRLLLVDAPEWNQGGFGRVATRALRAMLPRGLDVRLETDVQRTGPYGRLLAYVYLPDGRMVNKELLDQGMAILAIYPPNVRYLESLRLSAERAQANLEGLWRENGFDCTPNDFRRKRCTPPPYPRR